jgi:SulP family sulfate permease
MDAKVTAHTETRPPGTLSDASAASTIDDVPLISRRPGCRIPRSSAGPNRFAGITASLLFSLVAGIDGLSTSIAFSALIFTGSLASGFGMGVGLILLSSIVLVLAMALFSRYPSSIGQVRKPSVAILATAIAGATAAMPADASDDTKILTAFAILAVSGFATGLLFWISGAFRLGRLMRYLPYSVIAGFLAGSGALMVQGAVMMVLGEGGFVALLQSQGLPVFGNLLVSILFAAILLLSLGRFSHPATGPCVMLWAGLLFYGLLAVIGLPVETARLLHWLPALPPDPGLNLPSPLETLWGADWLAVAKTLPAVASVVLLSMVGLLLNVSGLEVATRREIDANREMRTAGLANIAVGLLGGPPGFSSLSMTMLANRMGARTRLVGLSTAAVLVLMLPFAGQLAGIMPVFIAAGLMMTLGFEMLQDWLWKSRRHVSSSEWLTVLAIPLGMVMLGFLAGMALGLALSVVTFVYNYASLSVIRAEGSGRERRSSVDRPIGENALLDREGERVQLLELQEFLFFGTAEHVMDRIRRRLRDGARPSLDRVVIDFHRVSGMDAAAATTFLKTRNLVAGSGAVLLLCGLSEAVETTLRRNGIDLDDDPALLHLGDLDQALEHCEQHLLATLEGEAAWQDVEDYLARTIGPSERLEDLVAVMQRIEFAPGERIIRAGETGDDLFLLWKGRAKIEARLPNGRTLRLRTVTPGVVLGEIALYREGPRTADVVAERPSTVYRLARRQLTDLEQSDPQLAVLVHLLCATTLSERLTIANRVVQALHA